MKKRIPSLAFVFAIFLIGLFVRLAHTQFFLDYDEMIYRALVEQLRAGHGYTLKGHVLLSNVYTDQSMYNAPYFYHPPFAIYFFSFVSLFFHELNFGLSVAQFLCFAIFYFFTLASLHRLQLLTSPLKTALISMVIAFSPVFAQTNTKVWIDNPRLAFLAVHFFLTILAAQKKSGKLYALSIFSALAVILCKVDALLALLFVQWIGYALSTDLRRTKMIWSSLVLGVSALAATAWMIGTGALEYGSGKPSAQLLQSSNFVAFVTLDLSPNILFLHYVQVFATLLPSIAILWMQGWKPKLKNIETICMLWILAFWIFYTLLAMSGFSKLLRYEILSTPAAILLFSFALSRISRWQRALAIILFCAWGLEVYTGFDAISRNVLMSAPVYYKWFL